MPDAAQYTLGLFDSSALGWTVPTPTVASPAAEERDEEPEIVPAPTAQGRGVNFALNGDRRLARGWPSRAKDNVAAIVLSKQLEDEGRAPTAAEQEQLIRFIGFGATELAQNAFPLPGESECRPGWQEIGQALADATTAPEYAALQRSTQLYVTWNIHRIGVDGQGGKYEHNCGVAEPLADVGHSGTSARLAEHARRSRAGTAHNRRLRARCFDVFGVQRGIRR